MSPRIAARFAQLRAQNRAGFIPFVTAGDPDAQTFARILSGLPRAGADLIEIGMPFSDPMAEGKPIQASSLRALQSGQTMRRTLEQLQSFRNADPDTPVILMGYYNPICAYGLEAFASDAGTAGADGLIVVDLPPEEDEGLRLAAAAHEIATIRLATPTSDANRLQTIVLGASGFIYYVSLTGVTGAAAIDADAALSRITAIRAQTDLPVAVGFGIRTQSDAARVAKVADAVVVGSAMVQSITNALQNQDDSVEAALTLCSALSGAVRAARPKG
ncbi:MAG TPA: tryptophan synthase subunit alpha [Alphaproteobacteria bacterium]|nr:tryptophan synthase subunit alpha [Alphaproteobacteria bacterium]